MPYQDPNSDNLYSTRVEDKFICKLSDLDAIIEEVEYYLDPYYPTKNTDFVNITSTYFDTDDLSFLKLHLAGGDRKKIRLRCYAPNGKQADEKFLEIKYKENGHKKKARVRVDALNLAQAIGGEDISESNRKINKELTDEDYDSAIKLIKEACKPGLVPMFSGSYKRLSYEGDGIRVTIDRDLDPTSFAALKNYDSSNLKSSPNWDEFVKLGTAYTQSKNCVVEVKYEEGDAPPKWLKKLLDKFAEHQGSFSKYVYGIYQELS